MSMNGRPANSALEEVGRRQLLRRVLVAWFFGAAWMSVTTGAVLTRYAKLLHVTEFGFGVLAAIPFLAAFAQLPASLLLERYGHRKRLFLVANFLHRSTWLLIALLPWLVSPARGASGLITLMLLSALASNMTAPSWFSWLTDMVPPRIRGRYLSRRTQAGQVVSLVLTISVGLLLDQAERASGLALARVLSLLLALAAVSGIIDIAFFVGIPDHGQKVSNRQFGLKELFLDPLRNRSFRFYLGFTSAMTFSIGYVGQFSWLYLYDVVHVTNMQANLLLVAYPLLAAFLAVPFWGRLIDRLGRKPVAMIATACVIHGGAIWVLVRPGHLLPAYWGVLLAAFAWPGVDLSSYNILLGLVRARRGAVQNTAYVALNSVVVAASGAASGLCGGWLAHHLRDWQGALAGVTITYHGILFLISALFRFMALWFLRGIEDPRAFSARQAVQYIAAEMYSNIQGTLMTPVKLAGKLSYKIAGRTRR